MNDCVMIVVKRVTPEIVILLVRLRNGLLSLVKLLRYLIEISLLLVIFTVVFLHVNYMHLGQR